MKPESTPQRIQPGDTIDCLFGALHVQVTEDDLAHLRNGGYLVWDDGEFTQIVLLKP